MRRIALISTALALLATAAPAGATFAGRNGLVAYGAFDGVHVMQADGTRDRIVSRVGPARDLEWGPRGNRIAFSRGGSIWVANLNTGTTSRLTHGKYDLDPSWSSNGGSIAYTRYHGTTPGVWRVRLSDGQKTQIVAARVGAAEWSPDGRWIAYSADADVHVVGPNGQGDHTLVDFPDGEGEPLAGSLSWAPDTSELAILTTANVAACDDCELLWTVNSDGSDLHKVTSRFRDLGFPFWSPDGESISFCEFAELQSVEKQQAVVHHGERYVGPTCGESWQARP
jgi:Tol biopolymer transport system component